MKAKTLRGLAKSADKATPVQQEDRRRLEMFRSRRKGERDITQAPVSYLVQVKEMDKSKMVFRYRLQWAHTWKYLQENAERFRM